MRAPEVFLSPANFGNIFSAFMRVYMGFSQGFQGGDKAMIRGLIMFQGLLTVRGVVFCVYMGN